MALPFPSLASIQAAIAAGQYDDAAFLKAGGNGSTAGFWRSTWALAGTPAAGSTDAGGTQYVNGSGGSGASANVGGLSFATPAVTPKGRILTAFMATSNQMGSVVIADRLCAIAGISVASTGSKTLTTLPALPRWTNGIGVEVWLEVTTATTTTAFAAFMDSYTGSNNGSGTSAGSGNAITASAAALSVGNMVGPLLPLTPDVGVTGVASINIVTAAAAGVVNVVLLRRLATLVPIVTSNEANGVNLLSQIPTLPIIVDGTTLMVMFQAGNTTGAQVSGQVSSVYQ